MELYALRLEARVVTDPGGRRLLTLDVARIQPKRCAERQVPHTKGAIPAELDIIFASTGSEVDVAGLIDRGAGFEIVADSRSVAQLGMLDLQRRGDAEKSEATKQRTFRLEPTARRDERKRSEERRVGKEGVRKK